VRPAGRTAKAMPHWLDPGGHEFEGRTYEGAAVIDDFADAVEPDLFRILQECVIDDGPGLHDSRHVGVCDEFLDEDLVEHDLAGVVQEKHEAVTLGQGLAEASV